MTFSTLGLSAELLRAVADQGYTVPTPVQRQAIPAVLAGGDLLAGAQTGTGKTAGFVLPMLQRLSTQPSPYAARPRKSRCGAALILTPTRELAAQVEASIRTYGKHLKLTSMVVFGGVGLPPQTARLKRGVHILVATRRTRPKKTSSDAVARSRGDVHGGECAAVPPRVHAIEGTRYQQVSAEFKQGVLKLRFRRPSTRSRAGSTSS